MRSFTRIVLISSLSLAVSGCSADPEKAAADARDRADDARVNAADANARVTVADARVKAADAVLDATEAANQNGTTTGKTSKTKGVIPSGTLLRVSLIDALDSDTNRPGDHFLASLSEAIVVDGVTLLHKGTQVRGRVVDVEGAGRVKGRASIRLVLTDIMQGERLVAIETGSFTVQADSSKTRDAKVIAGGAGLGAIVGAIADGKKGAGIGAITGGGAGTGIVLATKGKEIHYGPETRLTFTLTSSVAL